MKEEELSAIEQRITLMGQWSPDPQWTKDTLALIAEVRRLQRLTKVTLIEKEDPSPAPQVPESARFPKKR